MIWIDTELYLDGIPIYVAGVGGIGELYNMDMMAVCCIMGWKIRWRMCWIKKGKDGDCVEKRG